MCVFFNFLLFSSLYNWCVALDILGTALLPLLNNYLFLKAKQSFHICVNKIDLKDWGVSVTTSYNLGLLSWSKTMHIRLIGDSEEPLSVVSDF